jgi:hypothetical protein
MFGTNPDRPIDTSSFLTNQPPAVENGSLRDFILLNILTCGIYGSFETLTKKNRVTHLQVHESNLQKEASRIFAIFQNLDNRIQSIQKNVLGAASHTDSIDTSLVEIQETNKNLRYSTRLNL